MKKIIIICLILSFVSVFSPIVTSVWSSENAKGRDETVDRAIGGMEKGSRILSPKSHEAKALAGETPGRLSSKIDLQNVLSERNPEKALLGHETEGVSGGSGGISGPTGTGTGGTGGGTSEPSTGGGGTTEPSSGGATLIDVDADVNLDSGTVDAGVGVDTSAGIEDSTILDADLSATDGSSTTDIDTVVTGDDLATGGDLLSGTVENTLGAESSLDAEVDASGSDIGGEAEAGVEADVEGTGAGDDVASDPADGLTAGL